MEGHLEFSVICKKCRHGARLYCDPHGGGIKTGKGKSVAPFSNEAYKAQSPYWVVAVCKLEGCKNFNKPVFLSENDFKDLKPRPYCPVHRQEMKPGRNMKGKGNYLYICENKGCQSSIMLAKLLPVLK